MENNHSTSKKQLTTPGISLMRYIQKSNIKPTGINSSQVMKLMEIENGASIQIAVNSQTPSFHQLLNSLKLMDRNDIIKGLSTYIQIIVNNAWTLPTPLSTYQAVMIVDDLVKQYPDFTIEDVVCILRMARTGQFGSVYNHIDQAMFFEWVQKYLDSRLDIWESEYNKKKSQHGSPVRDSQVIALSDKMIRKSNRPPDERMFENK